ncbi:MAG: Putative inner membrane protein YjeT (clustered with HflC) [Burkholderiaceae bacterium]|nr:MAG: Putative inner membrane protein YjeT (clustered with HflC) [Burkholderiaceae bacterium]
MDSSSFWTALALVLVIEGSLPLLSPAAWRRMFAQILRWRDGQLRFFGLCSIAVGLLLLWLAS